MPKKLERRLLYESAYVCAICQGSGCHIHHIDHDHSNNNEENLVVLCAKHHDEAHTKRQLSKNLSSHALQAAKKEWTEQVSRKRQAIATASGQKLMKKNKFISAGIAWGYINHKRVAQMANPSLLDHESSRYFQYCVAKGLIDQKAVVIRPKNVIAPVSIAFGTIYDWFEFGDDQRVHLVYTALVDQISSNSNVVHLDPEAWAKTYVKELVKPGAIIFVNRAFYFKTVQSARDNEHRLCRTFKQKVEMEFYIDTRDMFGTTSVTVSFIGHKHCAALVQLKSLEETNDGRLILHCTPLALGVGFSDFKSQVSV